MPDRPLLVTSDPDLLDDLLRLCAAAGVEPQVASDLGAARGSWAGAPAVVLGDELARPVLAGTLPPGRTLLLVARDVDGDGVWTRGSRLGAAGVFVLPAAEPLLVDRLAAMCAEPTSAAPVVAVVGGRGGCGASTLAGALAVTAAAGGWRPMLVDADPLGGGQDLLLGCEDLPGLRWSDLTAATGEISAPALSSALPLVAGLRVLSWDRGEPREVPAATARAVLAAARAAHDLVVADLPRHLGPATEVILAGADTVLLVVPAEVRAVAAAGRVAAHVGLLARDIRVVTRGPAPSGLSDAVIADLLGLPLAGRLKPEPRLVRGLERGEPPARGGRGPLADLCRSLLDTLAGPGRAAA